MHQVLVNPIVAACLGAAFGVGLLYASRPGYALVDPGNPAFSYLVVIANTFGRLLLAAFALGAYLMWLRSGLVPFSLGLGAGFFVMFNVELVRFARSTRLVRKGGW